MTEQNKTKVPAELIPAGDYPVVSTDAVMDKQKGKTQEEVNTEAGEKIAALEESVGSGGSVDTRIENAVNTEKTRAENVEAQLSNEIDVLQKQDIVPVDSLPSVADADPEKIYRVVGTTSYTDYMVDTMADPTAWKTLATYSFPGIDDTPTAGSDNLVKSGGVQNELALGAVYDVSAKNPTAGPNNDGKFESLSALLSDANINTLIPIAVRKGGMSVKFVQSSDNKYIRYNLIADEFTTDVTKWAIDDGGIYVENPEFIYVKTDAENKILWAVRTDGTIFYGAGIPPQVVNYINDKIADLSLDEYEDIVAFLNDLEKGDKTLQTLLNEKVDKVEGKSLIDAEFAEGISQIENPEFVEAHTDAKDKVLYGIKTNGDFYFGAGVPSQIQEELDNKVDLADFAEVAANKVDKEEGKSLIDTDYASSQSAIDNPEYLQVTTDSEDKILEGITANGEKQINIPVDTPSVAVKHIDNKEWLNVTIDRKGRILEGIDKSGEKVFGKIPAQIDKHINETIDKRKDEIKKEIEEELVVDIDTATSKSVYFKNYGFSPLIRGLEPHPLVYSVNKFINRPLVLSDGRIVFVYVGSSESSIKIINLDGTENTLLTLTGASGYRLLWMDSKKNIYTAPALSSATYSSIGGLYRLAYNNINNTYANEFVRVLDLYDTNVMPGVPQDKDGGQEHNFTIWTMTEDRNGRMYAGVYGQPYCPYLFVSTDGGETWSLLKNMETYAPGGKHIHFIEYNKYDNSLYCTVGEINKLLKSTDGGNNWVDMGVTLERMKSTSILCVEDGIILGSDYAYWAMMYKVYPDGSYRTTAKTLANAIFSIRESDVTGWLYAFGVIDSATKSLSWYPPSEAISDESVLQAWIDSNPPNLASWQQYHDSMKTLFPDDCIIPQHAIVLISKDRGETWQLLFITEGNLSGMGGYFHNGEIGVSLMSNRTTFIISEGKHKYAENGIDVEGEVFAKVIDGSSKIVTSII